MTSHLYKRTSLRLPYCIYLAAELFIVLSLVSCSRSPWMKTDGHEVSPREHLECSQQIQQNSNGEVFEQKVLEQRIEQCMLDKGYRRRPWWQLNDMHWHIKNPAF